MQLLMIQLNKFDYQNKNAAENLIRYITRTRPNEDRANELLGYGSYHGFIYQKPIEELISEFEFIQKQYHADGSLMCHYVIHISSELYARMNNDLNILNGYASACCKYIYGMGHQACFAIHYSKKDRLHIHLAINTINFKTGFKLRQYYKEIRNTIEYPLQQLLYQHTYTPYHENPFNFDSLESSAPCIF